MISSWHGAMVKWWDFRTMRVLFYCWLQHRLYHYVLEKYKIFILVAQMLLYITYLTTQLHIFTWVIKCDRYPNMWQDYLLYPKYWPYVSGSTDHPWIPLTKGKIFALWCQHDLNYAIKKRKMRRRNLCKCYQFNGTSVSCGLWITHIHITHIHTIA